MSDRSASCISVPRTGYTSFLHLPVMTRMSLGEIPVLFEQYSHAKKNHDKNEDYNAYYQ